MSNHRTVLNGGYVRLADHMGSDLSVVNAARASFLKKSEEMTPDDERLIRFLARSGHMSPFRHAAVTLEVKGPLLVRSQWFKYVIGGEQTPNNLVWDPTDAEGTGNGDDGSSDPLRARNEASRRYVTMDLDFYVPEAREWRSAPENRKQGSGPAVSPYVGLRYRDCLLAYIKQGEELFDLALSDGIAPEQARLFLPAYAMFATWHWTTSLQGIAHFLQQRLAHDAQSEIRDYAQAVRELVEPLFPVSLAALMGEGR